MPGMLKSDFQITWSTSSSLGLHELPISKADVFIVVDSHRKWPEVVQMNSTTASSTVNALRDIVGRLSLPNQTMSENGPQFISDEFKTFTKMNGIKHTLSPHHPRTNGLVERFV